MSLRRLYSLMVTVMPMEDRPKPKLRSARVSGTNNDDEAAKDGCRLKRGAKALYAMMTPAGWEGFSWAAGGFLRPYMAADGDGDEKKGRECLVVL